MIIIKMNKDKWRLQLGDEIWEFNTRKEFIECLNKIIDFKNQYGRIF